MHLNLRKTLLINTMASTFRLKRKTFSSQPKVYHLQRLYSGEKEGMSPGAKAGLTTAAALGTAALGFAGAKKGFFGSGAMKGANKLWAQAGGALKKAGLEQAGNKMIQSGKSGMLKSGLLARGEKIAAGQVARSNQLKAYNDAQNAVTNATAGGFQPNVNEAVKSTASWQKANQGKATSVISDLLKSSREAAKV
jgi:hypothetical protein